MKSGLIARQSKDSNWLLRLGLLLGACLLASCASTSLPPQLSQSEEAYLDRLPLRYSVGVAKSENVAYSKKLEAALVDSGAFQKVAPLESFKSPPDFVAKVEEPVYGTAMIPAATILSAGIIPTSTRERYGVVFSLTPSRNPSKRHVIDGSYFGSTTLGWAALPLSASPDFTREEPEKSDRFRRMIGYKVAKSIQ